MEFQMVAYQTLVPIEEGCGRHITLASRGHYPKWLKADPVEAKSGQSWPFQAMPWPEFDHLSCFDPGVLPNSAAIVGRRHPFYYEWTSTVTQIIVLLRTVLGYLVLWSCLLPTHDVHLFNSHKSLKKLRGFPTIVGLATTS